MSLYNTLFGVNDVADVLLAVLKLHPYRSIPRFRDIYLEEQTIVVYTRTGGGNRMFYENEKSCRENYPQYFTGEEKDYPVGPWNDDLRKHVNYLSDVDCDFDCTYAYFSFSFPTGYEKELKSLASQEQSLNPRQKWKILLENLKS